MVIDWAQMNIENEYLLFDILQQIQYEHESLELHMSIDQLISWQMQDLSHSIDPKSIPFNEFCQSIQLTI